MLERNDHHHHQEKKVGGQEHEQVQGGQKPRGRLFVCRHRCPRHRDNRRRCCRRALMKVVRRGFVPTQAGGKDGGAGVPFCRSRTFLDVASGASRPLGKWMHRE